MSDKTKRIIAIIALVFMGVFTFSFIIFLAKPDLWNGAIAFIALFSGLTGVGLFLFIRFYESSKESQIVSNSDDESDNEATNTEENEFKAMQENENAEKTETDITI